MMNRRFSVLVFSWLILGLGFGGCYRVAGRVLEIGPPEARVTVEKDVMVKMRDGIHLATDIFKPDVPGRYPVVLCRLPYGKASMGYVGKLFAQRGYIFVIQDCRACFRSEGDVFIPFVYDNEDGMDTVAWIADQPWFNGKLGTWGGSYFGYTQWAVAADNPYLGCFYPQITSAKLNMLIFTGGAFHYRLATGWSSGVGKQNVGADESGEGEGSSGMVKEFLDMVVPGKEKKAAELEGGYYNLPLEPEMDVTWDDVAGKPIDELAVELGFYEQGEDPPPDAVDQMLELLNYPAFAEYSDPFNFKDRYQQVSAPAFMVSGWFDIFLIGQIQDFVNMRKMSKGNAAEYSKIIIGPWGHVTGTHPDAVKGAKTFAMIKDLMVFDWYDHWLKGEENGIEAGAPIRIYVMGKNIWRDEYEWPLERTQYTDYYLHSNGRANTNNGDGVLSTEPPGMESPDTYTYDPRNPVSTVGGNNLLENVGTKDQTEVEARDDVLVFTSAELKKDLEVTGPIRMILYASSSAVDTDFMAKLCDVYPDGTSWNIQDGAIRARYRESYEDPSLIDPGEIYEYEIDLWATSNCFLKGHRIRVQVSSSNFPRFDRNTNAGGQGGSENIIPAEQTIYHDRDHPSRIILPVIP